MKLNKANLEVSLVDATSFAASCAQKHVDSNEVMISNSITLGANQTSSNYAHGRNMANSSSFRPPTEFQNPSRKNESGVYEDSSYFLEKRLEF